jgi:hypothetical protein
VLSVECASNLQLSHPGLFGRVGSEGGKLLEGASNHNLASPIAVRSGKPVQLGFCDYLIGVATQHGAHAGGRPGGCGCHCTPAFAYEHHGLLRSQNTAGCSSSDLTDGMARARTNAPKRVGGMREKLEESDESSAD